MRITSLNKNDDITAAEKKMTRLMERLSHLIDQDEEDSKRDLLSCAKDIIETSDEVARFAKELARECRDERMQMVGNEIEEIDGFESRICKCILSSKGITSSVRTNTYYWDATSNSINRQNF